MSDINLSFSHSQLGTWNSCRMKWYFSYVLGLKAKDKPASMALGTMAHEFLAEYYRYAKDAGFSNEEGALAFIKEFTAKRSQDVETIDELSMLGRIGPLMQRYILEQSLYRDKKFEVLEVEQHYELPVEISTGETVTFQLYLDLLTRDRETGKIWLWDHKTHSARPWGKSKIMMDPQLPAYAVILREHGVHVHGMIYNFLNVYEYKSPQPTPKLFTRENTYRTPEELDNMFVEMKKGIEDIIANHDKPRRTLGPGCDMCHFQDPCLMLLKGFPAEEAFDFNVFEQGEVNDYYVEAAG